MRCIVCSNHHVELLRRTNSDSAHNQSPQAWLKYLCHKCHFVWTVHFLYGRKEIIGLLEDSGKIQAIRMYRMATGTGLYESKAVVDEIAEEINYTYSTTVEGIAKSKSISRSEENIT